MPTKAVSDHKAPAGASPRRFSYSGPTYAALWERFRNDRGHHARNDLLLAYEPLVLVVVSQLSDAVHAYWDREDLASFGLLGLIAAIDRFDDESPIERFPSYASTCIRGAIFDEMRRLDWLPRGVRRQVSEYRTALDSLGHELKREPEAAEVLDAMGISGPARQDVMSGVQSSQLLRLDHVSEVSGPDGTITLVDTLADDKTTGPEEAAVESDEIAALRKAVDELPERQRLVLTLHLFHGYTLEQIGLQLGVTASRACQIEAEAVRGLRRLLNARDRDEEPTLVS